MSVLHTTCRAFAVRSRNCTEPSGLDVSFVAPSFSHVAFYAAQSQDNRKKTHQRIMRKQGVRVGGVGGRGQLWPVHGHCVKSRQLLLSSSVSCSPSETPPHSLFPNSPQPNPVVFRLVQTVCITRHSLDKQFPDAAEVRTPGPQCTDSSAAVDPRRRSLSKNL